MANAGQGGKSPKRADGERRWGRRIGIVALWLVGSLVLIFLLAAIFVASPLFERTLKAEVLPRISRTLEREVTVQDARGSLLPVEVRLEQLRMEGMGELPIFRADVVEVRVKAWRTIVSLGKVIALKTARIEGMEANLVRLPDGTWDLPAIPERPPDAPRREVRVDEATVENGVARVVDRSEGLAFETTDISLSASMSDTVAALHRLRASMADGQASVVARALLEGDRPTWAADLEVAKLDLSAVPPLAGTLEGRMSATARVAGEGTEKEYIFRSLTGTGRMELIDGKWINQTFLEDLATEIGEFIYLPKGAGPEAEDALDLGSPVRAAATVEDGWVQITEPPRIRAAFGGAEITGRVSLTKQLDLLIEIGLSPEFLTELSEGLVEPEEPVPVNLRVQGTMDEPDMSLVDTEDLSGYDPSFLDRVFRAIENLLPGGD